MERQRKVDINKLNQEQADEIQAELSRKIKDICDNACEEANKYLKVYGLKAIMLIDIKEINRE